MLLFFLFKIPKLKLDFFFFYLLGTLSKKYSFFCHGPPSFWWVFNVLSLLKICTIRLNIINCYIIEFWVRSLESWWSLTCSSSYSELSSSWLMLLQSLQQTILLKILSAMKTMKAPASTSQPKERSTKVTMYNRWSQ